MSKRYRHAYRGYLIDHHSPDPPVIDFKNLNYKEYEDAIKRACIDQLMVYCKDHWGSAFYPTKVGRKHPAIESDYVGKLAEICANNNIEFMAYYSLGYDTHAALNYPDWALRDEEGRIQRIERISGRKWHWVCGNTGYRDYSIRYVQEIVKRFNPDSLIFDQVDNPLCFCGTCKSLFQKKYGIPMPMDEIGKERMWRELLEFLNDCRCDFIESVIFSAKESDPDIAVSINGGHISLTKNVLDLVDWVFAEPWCESYLSSVFARAFDKYTQIGPGTVSTVYDPPPASIFILETARIVSQGCRCFMYSPSQKPDGSLNRVEFEKIAEAYGEIAKYQNLLIEREPITDVGVVYSENSRLYDREVSHKDCLEQALIFLSQSMYPFGVVPEWELQEKIDNFSILILPNVSCMNRNVVPVLERFVAEGGVIICTCATSLMDERGKELDNFQLASLFGCNYEKKNREYVSNLWGSYLNRADESHPVWDDLPSTQLPALPPYIQVKESGATIFASHVLPCVEITDSTWVSWWAPPPKYETDHPAVCYNEYKKGKVFYISFRLFGTIDQTKEKHTRFFRIRWMSQFVGNLLRWALPSPRIVVNTNYPHSLGCTYFRTSDNSKILIHQINHSVDCLGGEVNPIQGGEVVIRKDFFRPETVRLVYPQRQEIPIEETAEAYHFRAPPVGIHNILMVEGVRQVQQRYVKDNKDRV